MRRPRIMRAVDTSNPWIRPKASMNFAMGSLDNPLMILTTIWKTGSRPCAEKSDKTYGKRLSMTVPTKRLTKFAM